MVRDGKGETSQMVLVKALVVSCVTNLFGSEEPEHRLHERIEDLRGCMFVGLRLYHHLVTEAQHRLKGLFLVGGQIKNPTASEACIIFSIIFSGHVCAAALTFQYGLLLDRVALPRTTKR